MYITTGLMKRNRFAKNRGETISNMEKEAQSNRKPYVLSNWGKEMVSSIKSATDSEGNFKPGGKIIEELDKKGAFKINEHAEKLVKDNSVIENTKNNQGGFSKGD